MGFFRRREPLHEKLAREGGLASQEPPPHDTRPRWGETGVHGLHRLREWDAVVSAEFEGPPLAELHFSVLPDGTMVVDEDVNDADLTPLADAVETELERPYRAEAVRRDERTWFVGARQITVVELPEEEIAGDRVTLTVHQGERTLLVDGERSFGSVPVLEALGDGDAYVVEAERLDGPFWEVRVTPL
jgi:hypothetical protein